MVILLIGMILRLWNVNWDANFHLHPDERAILLFSLPLEFPLAIQDFFSATSSWNPHFFAYGSFPLYLLKILGSLFGFFSPTMTTYDGIHIVGRVVSALFDTGTILVLYFLTKKIFTKYIALLASFFYAISVLPIQLSHFYAVDTILTFFSIFLLYQLVRFYEYPTKRKALGIGILFAFALATKTSAFVLFVAIIVAIGSDFSLLFLKQPHKPHIWFPHIPKFLERLFLEGSVIFISTLGTFFLLEPYAFIDSKEFWTQTMQQAAMTKSAFTFPYTLQYVGKVPYLYEIENIVFWGMGPLLGFCSLVGLFFYHIKIFRKNRRFLQKEIIVLAFFWIYFLLIGSFAIGFMRYALPLYPFFSLFAGFFISTLFHYLHQKNTVMSYILLVVFLVSLFIWPISFMNIYQNEPTRVTASKWIIENIPQGKTIALEHWDDSLPLFGQHQYRIVTLELYNPDSPFKWQTIHEQLSKTDYIILASNRLYTPLSKLTNCKILPQTYCYRETAKYYEDLFHEKLGFYKIAEFSVYPTVPWSTISIDDSSADESFTVYDHPKIIIFKKK